VFVLTHHAREPIEMDGGATLHHRRLRRRLRTGACDGRRRRRRHRWWRLHRSACARRQLHSPLATHIRYRRAS